MLRSLLRRLLFPGLDKRIVALQQSAEQQLDRSRTLEREIEALRGGRWLRGALDGIVADSLARRVEPDGRPKLGPFEYLLREQHLGLVDVKVLGSALGRVLFEQRARAAGGAAPQAPARAGLQGGLCRQADIETPWLAYWAHRLQSAPFYHRKLWEDCFVLQVLWEAGMLAPGRTGLGFGVGQETLPSVLAAHGVRTTATDLPAGDARARPWVRTGQHAGGEEARAALFRPGLLGAEEFERRVSFRAADMRRIPPDLLRGGFDLVWSSCAAEHLGGLGRGADFVLEAMRCLRPGGVAVHTTEFNTDAAGGTLRRGGTVLFQRRHLDALSRRLAEAGHRMLPLDDAPGEGPLDAFVDLPPYGEEAGPGAPQAPHLRLSIRGYPVTSAGIVARACIVVS